MADTLRFRNLDGSGPVPIGRVLRWVVLDRLAGRRRRSPDRAPVPEIDAGRRARSGTPPLEGTPRHLARARELARAGCTATSVLIDPALGPRISGVIARNAGPGLPVGQLPPVDAALVTHNHYDHLDLPTLRAVGAPVVAGLGTRAQRRRASPCTELGWWDRRTSAALAVTFVPCQHWSRRGLVDANEALWGGFVVESGGRARLPRG